MIFDRLEPKDLLASANHFNLLHNYRPTFVYYFDGTGKPIEIPKVGNQVTEATPDLPVTFNVPIRLEGYELTNSIAKQGAALVLLLYWRAIKPVATDYAIFVHLTNNNGEMIGGLDSQPRGGQAPTSSWKPGNLVIDSIVFPISENAPKGIDYSFSVGMYDLSTMERLSIVDSLNRPLGHSIIIAPITIQ